MDPPEGADRWELDSKLTHNAALAQRKAIEAAQDGLIAELAGTTYKVVSKFKTLPGLSLEVGPDALAVLENSEYVKEVYLELVLRPLLFQSVPLIGGNLAWESGYDGTGQAIVVVDTGIDYNHPFLSTATISKVIAARHVFPLAAIARMVKPLRPIWEPEFHALTLRGTAGTGPMSLVLQQERAVDIDVRC